MTKKKNKKPDTSSADTARAALALSRMVQPFLKGQGPEMQGAVLADLVGIYFAGHHPEHREEAIELWFQFVRELITQNVKESGKWEK